MTAAAGWYRSPQRGEARLGLARPLWAAAQQDFETRFGAARADALRDLLAGLIATDLTAAP